MKKISLAIVTTVLLIMTSCNKENVTDNTPDKIGDYYEHKLDAKTLIQNDEDPTDVVFNRGLVSLSEAMLEVLKDENKRQFILDKAKNNQKGFVTFDEMFEVYPNLKIELNTFLSNSELAKEMEIKDYDSYVSTMTHTDIEYIPVINIPNIENTSNNGNYFISPGIEVEDNDDLGIDDEIFSWYNNDGIISEISIGEEILLSKNIPLYVITPHTDFQMNETTSFENSINQLNANNSTNQPSENHSINKTNTSIWIIDGMQINYRYEGSGRSDVWATAWSWNYVNDDLLTCFRNGSLVHIYDKGFESIHKNQIGSYKKRDNSSFWYHNVFGFVANNNLQTFSTFERDWNATYKNLGTVYGTARTLVGKRKYWHEYYIHSGVFNTVTNGPTKSFNSGKGVCVLKID